MSPSLVTLDLRVAPPGLGRRLVGNGGARYLIERNVRVYRTGWPVLISGIFEPIFYLFSVGVGVSQLVGDVELPGGELVSYTVFVAPAMLASSAMNGALYRRDVQPVLQAEVQQAVRRGAGDAGHARRRRGR